MRSHHHVFFRRGAFIAAFVLLAGIFDQHHPASAQAFPFPNFSLPKLPWDSAPSPSSPTPKSASHRDDDALVHHPLCDWLKQQKQAIQDAADHFIDATSSTSTTSHEVPIPLYEQKNAGETERYVIEGGAYNNRQQRESAGLFGLGLLPTYEDSSQPKIEWTSLVKSMLVRRASDDELNHLSNSKPFQLVGLQVSLPRKIDKKVEELLAEMEGELGGEGGAAASEAERETMAEEQVDLVVRAVLREELQLSAQDAMQKAYAKGHVTTHKERKQHMTKIHEERDALIKSIMQPIREKVEAMGGQGREIFSISPTMRITLPLGRVRELVSMDEVELVYKEEEFEKEVCDGSDLRKIHQFDNFLDDGYTGEGPKGSSPDIPIGVFEIATINPHHPGWLDCGDGIEEEGTHGEACINGKFGRFIKTFSCIQESGCNETSTLNRPYDEHAMGVASVLFGDVTGGQDPGIQDKIAQVARSGGATEASAFFFELGPSTLALQRALDAILLYEKTMSTDGPFIVNYSAGIIEGESDCSGTDGVSRMANDFFRAGRVFVKSAGNQGGGGGKRCTVTRPGSAHGILTIGSLGDTPDLMDDERCEAEHISSFSSRGGDGDRSIVDLVAQGCWSSMYDTDAGYTNKACGTSFAAPVVAAAAAVFADWYLNSPIGSLIEDPGVLMAAMLMMGDRGSSSGSKRLEKGFDPLWGAGALRLRRFDDAGLDDPWRWALGWTCIDDGEILELQVNEGKKIDKDVDSFTGVIFWFDENAEQGLAYADLDLILKTADGDEIMVTSASQFDNKERVWSDKVGGKSIKLEVTGYGIPTTRADPICGDASQKVYYGWYFEDHDRDDSNGPTLAQASVNV